MKRLGSLLVRCLVLCMFLGAWPVLVQAQDLRVLINDMPLTLDTQPVRKNDRLLVPARAIFESLGYQMKWEAETETVTAVRGSDHLTMQVGAKVASYNNRSYALDTEPILQNGRILVPVRFVAESTGAVVLWQAESQSVLVYTKDAARLPLDSVVMLESDHMQGSGVVLSSDGYIAANYHVVTGAPWLSVFFQNGEAYVDEVRIAAYDIAHDIVVLKIDAEGLTPAKVAQSLPEAGVQVTAIGSPGGQMNVVSTGNILGANEYILCNSAEIDHGSSGGGLFNRAGELVGMTSAVGGDKYFAIPAGQITSLDWDKNLTLEEFEALSYTPSAPQFFLTETKKGEASIFWEPIYGAAKYSIFSSDKKDGKYEELINPNTGLPEWYWGYPECFQVTTNRSKNMYFKVASYGPNGLSEPSQPFLVKIP